MFASILLSILYRGNIWLLYNSYHKNKSQWKKKIWNYYMEKHAASISIDAIIASPLILPHGVTGIFITQSANIGKNVVVFQQVTIGANTIKSSKSYGAPPSRIMCILVPEQRLLAMPILATIRE